ncbi:MAG: metallophosphoesterase [Planctomycetes bacterium]|nr:metallophosphoesterase [Planctomycetota bacterium]
MKRGLVVVSSLAGCLLLLGVCGFQAYALIVHREAEAPLPERFGNFPRVRALLESAPQKESFAFAVAGDTKSTGTFEKIVEELRQADLDFAVLLGDCVYDGKPEEHAFFRAECREYSLPFPVFYVVGNHDVSLDDLPLARFEEMYGPTLFSMEYQGCLFLFLRTLPAPYSNEDTVRFLGELEKESLARYRHVVAFMHVPPPISLDVGGKSYAEGGEIMRLLEDLEVDYVFAGDYHGYARVDRGGAHYLVTGGGGARLDEKRGRQFHHALVLRVAAGAVSESIVFVEREHDFEDALERYAIVRAYPWFASHKAASFVLNVVALGVFAAFVALIFRARRGGRAAPRPARAQ